MRILIHTELGTFDSGEQGVADADLPTFVEHMTALATSQAERNFNFRTPTGMLLFPGKVLDNAVIELVDSRLVPATEEPTV